MLITLALLVVMLAAQPPPAGRMRTSWRCRAAPHRPTCVEPGNGSPTVDRDRRAAQIGRVCRPCCFSGSADISERCGRYQEPVIAYKAGLKALRRDPVRIVV